MDNAFLLAYPWLAGPLTQLNYSWQIGRLHHALLIQGQVGTGKLVLAQLLANALICQQSHDLNPCGRCKSCLLIKAGNHPDSRLISSDSNSIGVDEIRQAGVFVYQKSQIASRRVLLIHDANKLTESAANALLKTLEEPCPNVYLVLTSDNPSQLLATVRSRCTNVTVTASDPAQIYYWLVNQGLALDAGQFERLFSLANGAPLQLRQWLNEGKLDQVAQFSELVYDWLNGKATSIQLKEQLKDNRFALRLLHHLLVEHERGRAVHLPRSSGDDHFALVDTLFSQLNQFDRNDVNIIGQNKPLALLHLLNNIQQLIIQASNDHFNRGDR